MTDDEKKTPCSKETRNHMMCRNMKMTYEGFDGERYRCKVCGESYFLDLDEMR